MYYMYSNLPRSCVTPGCLLNTIHKKAIHHEINIQESYIDIQVSISAGFLNSKRSIFRSTKQLSQLTLCAWAFGFFFPSLGKATAVKRFQGAMNSLRPSSYNSGGLVIAWAKAHATRSFGWTPKMPFPRAKRTEQCAVCRGEVSFFESLKHGWSHNSRPAWKQDTMV